MRITGLHNGFLSERGHVSEEQHLDSLGKSLQCQWHSQCIHAIWPYILKTTGEHTASSELYNLESVVSDQRRKVYPFFFCHRVLAIQLHDSPRSQSGLLQRRLPLYPFALFLFCLNLAFRHNITELVQVPAPIARGALKRKQTLSAHPAVCRTAAFCAAELQQHVSSLLAVKHMDQGMPPEDC